MASDFLGERAREPAELTAPIEELRRLVEFVGNAYEDGFADGLEATGVDPEALKPDENTIRLVKEDGADFSYRIEQWIKVWREVNRSLVRSRWEAFERFCEKNAIDARAVASELDSEALEEFLGIEDEANEEEVVRYFERLDSAHWDAFGFDIQFDDEH